MRSSTDQEKRVVIKQAARELFIHFGYTKTSMEDIARQAGLAKPTLYYYYPNKEALFQEIVIEEAHRVMEAVQSRLPAEAPADERLALFFRGLYEQLKGYARKMTDMPEYLCEHSPYGHPIVRELNTLFRDRLIPLLEAGKAQGLFHFPDTEITAATLVFLTDFLNLDWMRHHPEDFRDRVVDTMIEIILKGLKRRTG